MGIAALVCACASSKTSPEATTVTPPPTALTASAPAATATLTDYGLAGQVNAALLQAADISSDWHVAQNQNKVLDQRDVPGLTSGGKGAFVIVASPDKNEFVNQLAVVPDDGNVSGLLEAFDSENYLSGLTSGAADAQATVQALPDARAGAKALTFSGTQNAGTNPQFVNGEAVAFVHGKVFVIVIHGSFQSPKYPLSAAQLASRINARLNSVPGTS